MEYVGLILFLLQQLGMTLGVGASTFALIFYLSALKDDVVDVSERRFLGMVYTVLRVGLSLVILSGALITAAHVLGGEQSIVFEPAFLFKWFLIGVIVLNAILMTFHLLPAIVGGPIAGATWYALFFLHNIAPEIGLPILLFLYALWLALLTLIFHGVRMLTRGGDGKKDLQTQTPSGNNPSLVVQDVSPSRVAATAPLRKIPEFQGVAGGIKLQPAPVTGSVFPQSPAPRSTPPFPPTPIAKPQTTEVAKMSIYTPPQNTEIPRMPSPSTLPPQSPKTEARPTPPPVSSPVPPPVPMAARPPVTSVMPRTASEMAAPKPFTAAPSFSQSPASVQKITPPVTPSFVPKPTPTPQPSFAKQTPAPAPAAALAAQSIKPQATYSGLPLRTNSSQPQVPQAGNSTLQPNPDIPFNLGT